MAITSRTKNYRGTDWPWLIMHDLDVYNDKENQLDRIIMVLHKSKTMAGALRREASIHNDYAGDENSLYYVGRSCSGCKECREKGKSRK